MKKSDVKLKITVALHFIWVYIKCMIRRDDMRDSSFVTAFNKATNNYVNQTKDGTVIWNYVESDLALDGWMDVLGENFNSWFDDMVDQFLAAKETV